MAIIEVKIPSPGESITHVELFNWLVKDGEYVEKDTEIAELESDKATLMLVAYDSGKISLKQKKEICLKWGSVACNSLTPLCNRQNQKKQQFLINLPRQEILLNQLKILR